MKFLHSLFAVSLLYGCGRSAAVPSEPRANANSMAPVAWGTVLEIEPRPEVVLTEADRSPLLTVGRPWRVKQHGTGIVFVLIPPGEFIRGVADLSEGPAGRPRHPVRITRPYYLSETEVTNDQFRAFDPAHRSIPLRGLGTDGPHQPVVGVSYEKAVEFARHVGCDLPTEAQWEWACRTSSSESRVESEEYMKTHANVADASARRPPVGVRWHAEYDDGFAVQAPVRSFSPNPRGLYDVIGNVSEWCRDWYGEQTYQASLAIDPEGPSAGTYRVVRGGSALDDPSGCTCGRRQFGVPSSGSSLVGIRLCRPAE
jgi:formylglycine-generating enzyme required for sulfatase activity